MVIRWMACRMSWEQKGGDKERVVGSIGCRSQRVQGAMVSGLLGKVSWRGKKWGSDGRILETEIMGGLYGI